MTSRGHPKKGLIFGLGGRFWSPGNGKGGQPRIVTLAQDLRRHLREFIAWKKRRKEPTGPEDFLFVSERGEGFTTRGLLFLFQRAAERAGLRSRFSITEDRVQDCE